jgi:hypothetical protein
MCGCQDSSSDANCTCAANACPTCPTTKKQVCVPEPCSVINPISVVPIKSCESASGKYSIETTIKARTTGSIQSNVRTGIATGATELETSQNFHKVLSEILIEVIRSIVNESYTSNLSNNIDNLTDYNTALRAALDLSYTDFKNYIQAGQAVPEPVPNPLPLLPPSYLSPLGLAQIEYIIKSFHSLYLSSKKHIEVGSVTTTPIICEDGGGARLYQGSVDNCLFGIKIIYN